MGPGRAITSDVLERISEPVVFKNLINDWEASKWNFANIGTVFGQRLLKFRVGKNDLSEINFETECSYREATIEHFCQWLDNSCKDGNPLKDFNKNKYWCYADYKHLLHIFEMSSDIHQSVDWSVFGFPGRNGKKSTIWIGSKGSTTVCHLDTYGYNLVAQICGRKRWILFPPDQSENMYQTRVPFEESSHFSLVNIARPDLEKYPLFKKATPYIVTLEPGDVLLIPLHWWHHVESLDDSISVNTWIEVESDDFDRVKEGVVRGIIFNMMAPEGCSWLNPTEERTSHGNNMELLDVAIDTFLDAKKSSCNYHNFEINDDDDDDDDDNDYDKALKPVPPREGPRKRSRTETATESPKRMRLGYSGQRKTDPGNEVIVSREFDGQHVVRIRPSKIEELAKIFPRAHWDDIRGVRSQGSLPSTSASTTTTELLTRAMLQDDVITLITRNLLKAIDA